MHTLLQTGVDEYGNKFPIIFKSFADDKHPVHIYLTAVVVKLFGLTDFNIRATSAGIGVLSVFAIFFWLESCLKVIWPDYYPRYFLLSLHITFIFKRSLGK